MRMLLALTDVPPNVADIAALFALVRDANGRVDALLLEDARLAGLPVLPHAVELGARTATPRALDAAAMALSQRALSSRTRRELGALASRVDVAWTFEVRRKTPSGDAWLVDQGHDVVVLGPRGMSRLSAPHRSVSLIHEGSASALQALAFAQALARQSGVLLRIFTSSASTPVVQQVMATSGAAASGRKPALRTFSGGDDWVNLALAAASAEDATTMVVLEAQGNLARQSVGNPPAKPYRALPLLAIVR